MKEQRFACTACGQCCYGILPLTLPDALANAARFPLAMSWTPVRPTNRSYDLAVRMGISLQLPSRQKIAVIVAPVAYLPPAFACPALGVDNLCTIQEEKPLRCRTMPFYPYREPVDQRDQLVPRKGWRCDTSESAPVVYRDKKILDRADFDRERAQLLTDAPALRDYANVMVQRNTAITNLVMKVAANPIAGQFFVNFSSFLRIARKDALADFAAQQLPVLEAFAARTADQPQQKVFYDFYHSSLTDLRRVTGM